MTENKRLVTQYKIKVRKRSEAPFFMRWFVPKKFWFALGRSVYHPDSINPWLPKYDRLLRHEIEHVIQQLRNFLHPVLYLFGPLPIGLAVYRAWAEMQAYSYQIHAGEMTVDQALDYVCGKSYFWSCPRSWARGFVKPKP